AIASLFRSGSRRRLYAFPVESAGWDQPAKSLPAPRPPPSLRPSKMPFLSYPGLMPPVDLQHLRVLIANEKRDRLELLARVVIGLGHDVIAREIYVKEVGALTAREQPDVAIVGLGLSSEHALELIAEIAREASCPVIAPLHANDPAYIHE